MKLKTTKPFNLPWNQSNNYWICVTLPEGNIPSELESRLTSNGAKRSDGAANRFVMRTGRQWSTYWSTAYDLLKQSGQLEKAEVSVLAYENEPDPQEISVNKQAADKIQQIAENLWIGDALIENKITCYLQPVIDRRGKIYGYESFARMMADNGETVSGGRIISASIALGIEHMMDRYLHVEAIKTFTTNDLSGVLFVNFLPGFIHRPDIYLDGLNDAVQSFGIAPKHIALELTNAEDPNDKHHLKSIFDYCKSKGYAISLDDLESYEMAEKLVSEITPDFIKIDMALVRKINEHKVYSMVVQLVELAHKSGCTVIAEGVESEEVHELLKRAGVDLFQGYHFSHPSSDGSNKKS